MFMLYDNDNYYGSEKKKPSIVGRILKWSVYLLIAFIYVVFMIRIFMSCEPSESKILLFDDDTINAFYEMGEEDFVLYDIRPRNNFGDGDAFFLNNVVYLESSEQLQFTLRYKKNRLAPYLEAYDSQEYSTVSEKLLTAFDFTLKISTATTDTAADAQSSFIQDYYTYQFETNKYYYHKIKFDNVKVDYRETKLELFLNLSGGDSNVSKIILPDAFITSGLNNTNIEKISAEDYFARFTVFDINTEKKQNNVSKYETKTINEYTP